MGTAGTTLFLTESAIFVDRFVQHSSFCLYLLLAVFDTCLLSSAFLLLHGHAPFYSRCISVCIRTTCALRQTPHGHMRRGVLGSVCNALTLYVYFAPGTPFLYGVLRVEASTAVQPVRNTHVHFSSPITQHYPTLCLYRPPNTGIPMHTPLYSRCTGVCICTNCALRQTPHEHMRRGVLGSVCNASTLYVYFAPGTPFLYGVLRVQASTAVQPLRSAHVHFSSPITQYYPTLCLYRPPNTSFRMHTPLYSRCTGVCICTTCALRQTPHGHMRRGVLGSVCKASTLYAYFASGTPFLYGVLRFHASIAVQPLHSTHVHFSSPLTQHYPTLCLYRPPNTSTSMHTFTSLKHRSRTYSSTTSRLVVHAQLPT